jgi:hypothetical protein
MAAKGIWNLPDRLADENILQQWFNRRHRRPKERHAVPIYARAAHAVIWQLKRRGFRSSHIEGDRWYYVKHDVL